MDNGLRGEDNWDENEDNGDEDGTDKDDEDEYVNVENTWDRDNGDERSMIR